MPISRLAPVLLVLLTSVAHAAVPRALIVDGTDPAVIANVQSALIARGFSVDVVGSLPVDLDPYCCVWDMRPFLPLQPPEIAQYLAFLQQGHGLFLTGENLSCCDGRDATLMNAINNSFGGGPASVVGERPGTFEELADPFNPVTQTPNAVAKVTYNGSGVAIFGSVGSGDILTQDSGWPSLAAVSWPEGSLSNAPTGRLVTILDVNWLNNTFGFTDNAEFLENISVFLCPTTASGMTVTISTPPFALECPDPLDVNGQIDASDFDCVQPTTLAPPVTPIPARDPQLFAGSVGDQPGDEALLAVSDSARAGTDAEFKRSAPKPAALAAAATIVAVEVSLNGGPFVAVTSTTPPLPALAPVSFNAAGLALILGGNSVAIRATDDVGNQATATLLGTMLDTIEPAFSAATCQDVALILDATCQASFNSVPAATDACDPTLSFGSTPPLPVNFAAPGSVMIEHTATDDSGNQGTCTRTVTAEDKTIPTLTCAAPTTIECSASGGNPSADPNVIAWLATTTAADNCAVSSLNHNGPGVYPSGCTPGTGTTVVWTATDASSNPATCSSILTVRDSLAPTITNTPAPLALECSTTGGVPSSAPAVQAWVASFAATDICSSTVNRTNNVPSLIPSGCAPGKATAVVFTASDGCNNANNATSTVTVVDTTAPSLTVPAALTLECNGAGGVPRTDPAVVAWLASAASTDVCGLATIAHNAPALFPSGCGAGQSTTVNFTATDNCANATVKPASVTVRDTTAPNLSVPAPITLECSGPGGVPRTDPAIQAWLAAATAADVCDGATLSNDAPALFPSSCGTGTPTTVTFRAVDNCGNVKTLTSTVTVRDTTAPKLSVPAAITLECNSPGGVPLSDPQVQAWLSLATASDICDGAILSNDAPALFVSGCGAGTATVVTFRAVDNCGNVSTLTSTVTVRDSTPPKVSGNTIDGICLWPPNHNFYCIDDIAAGITASDVCDPDGVSLLVTECRSSQPEDSTGDGSFAPDCVITGGGKGVCVRSERQGNDPAGRVYTVTVEASDGCNNSSGFPVNIRVPHDSSPKQDCRRPNAGKDIPAGK